MISRMLRFGMMSPSLRFVMNPFWVKVGSVRRVLVDLFRAPVAHCERETGGANDDHAGERQRIRQVAGPGCRAVAQISCT